MKVLYVHGFLGKSSSVLGERLKECARAKNIKFNTINWESGCFPKGRNFVSCLAREWLDANINVEKAAHKLLKKSNGQCSVIAFSLGAKVVLEAMKLGLEAKTITIVGGAAFDDSQRGNYKMYNIYSLNDKVLKAFIFFDNFPNGIVHQLFGSQVVQEKPMGLGQCKSHWINVDMSEFVESHLSYGEFVNDILKTCGIFSEK